LIEQYEKLKPTPIESGTITFSLPVKFYDKDKKLCLEQAENGTWKLTKTDWQFDRATYELVVDSKTNLPTKILRQYVGSETYGEPKLFSYNVKLEEPKLNPLLKKQPFVKPCGMEKEGLAMATQKDDEYFKKLGLVKDPVLGWRRMYPEEYDQILKQQQKNKKQPKKKKGFFKMFKVKTHE
jgi:hypothetical protein